MKRIITIPADGTSPMNMDYYGHALLTQKGGWTEEELGIESEEMEPFFTKTVFEEALKKASRQIDKVGQA